MHGHIRLSVKKKKKKKKNQFGSYAINDLFPNTYFSVTHNTTPQQIHTLFEKVKGIIVLHKLAPFRRMDCLYIK